MGDHQDCRQSWQWTAATGLAVIALMIVIAVVIIFAVPKFKKVQKQTDKINQVTRENPKPACA